MNSDKYIEEFDFDYEQVTFMRGFPGEHSHIKSVCKITNSTFTELKYLKELKILKNSSIESFSRKDSVKTGFTHSQKHLAAS